MEQLKRDMPNMIRASYTKLSARKPMYFTAEKADKMDHHIQNVVVEDSLDIPGLPKVIIHGDMWCANMVFQV